MYQRRHDVPGEIFCVEILARDSLESEYENKDPMALNASTNPNKMYLHNAMSEADWQLFVTAMQKEVQDQMDNGNFTIIEIKDIPDDKTILRAVW